MWWCWWGRTAPARPIAWRRSRFSRRDAACGARRWRMSPTIRVTAPGRSPPKSRARSGLPRSAPASMRRARRRPQPAGAAGSTASRWVRPPRSAIICAWCGWHLRWTGCSSAPPRNAGASSTGWCWRSTANIPAACRRWNVRSARATGCSRCAITTTTGATRSNARTRCGFRLPVGADHARRLDGKCTGQ